MEYLIRSSHGVLTVDKHGYVIECQKDNNDPDGGGHLAQITRFDLVEWQRFWGDPDQTEIDILDLGYWYSNPETHASIYAAPDGDWRKEIAEILLQRKRADHVRAAAPQLLEALQLSEKIITQSGIVAGESLQIIRAAIAKAEGK